MNREGFLAELGQRLAGLPTEDREERLSFYSEMIDDRLVPIFELVRTDSEVGTYQSANRYVPISGLVSTNLYSEPNKF